MDRIANFGWLGSSIELWGNESGFKLTYRDDDGGSFATWYAKEVDAYNAFVDCVKQDCNTLTTYFTYQNR